MHGMRDAGNKHRDYGIKQKLWIGMTNKGPGRLFDFKGSSGGV